MLNQNSTNTEANNSGVFLKNYIDYVEEMPNDIQKCISRCREVDYKTKNLTCEIEKICEQMLSAPTDKKSRMKMQQLLAKLTELKDEKIHLSQSLAAQIDTKHKKVAESFQNNVFVKQERSPTPSTKTTTISIQQPVILNIVKQPSTTVITTSNIPPVENLEKTVGGAKRVRKTRIDNLDADSFDDNLLPPIKPTSQSIQSTSNNSKRANLNIPAKKVKKRKITKKQLNAQIAQETIDEVIHDDGIDPDETTYCICQQISYGEMIFCENDTCPIEWFHFSCVELTNKPKGRWFCPQCRGDKASVINKSLRKKQQESSAI